MVFCVIKLLYIDKHGISFSRSTLKQDKVDIIAAHIARSLFNTDATNNEKDDVEDYESDEEYEDVVLGKIGDDIDEDETSDATEQSENGEDDGEGDNDSDDDNDYGNDDDHDDDDDDDDDDDGDDGDNGDSNDNYSYSEDVQISDILCTTKSGRTCRTWKGRYLNY